MIKSIQKVIKIGSSGGVTIPAKEMKRLGISYGDQIKVTYEPIAAQKNDHTTEVVALTQELIARHRVALKNLSQR